MGTLFKRNRNTLCGVIIDIGSGSVTGSIVLSDPRKELPEMIYTHRESIPLRSTSTPVEEVRAMRRVLFSVILTVEQKGMAVLYQREKRMRVNRMVVSCTAPWSNTVTQIIHFERETPFTVTPQMIDQIITHAYEKEKAHTGEPIKTLHDEGQHVVEKLIIDITLNGYSIPEPYNKEASEITIAHVRGLVPTPILTALHDVEKHIPRGIEVRIHTSALILYCVLRDLYPQTSNALIVTVSGETTEIVLVQKGILYEAIAVAYGVHSLIRDIAMLCKTIPEEAQGYLRAYKQNLLTDAQEKMLMHAQQGYGHALEAALHELTLRYVLPQTIFLILDQDMEQFFTDTIQSAMNEKATLRSTTIVPLSPKHTEGLVVVGGGVVASPRLALTARFFHKLHACGTIDNTPLDN